MGKKLAQRMEEERRRYMRAARVVEVGFCCDMAVIALGRLGWGAKRLKAFEEAFSAAYEEYEALREADGKDDKDQTYYKACIDREIKQYAGELFAPFDERHGI